MDRKLFNYIETITPKFNPVLAGGLVSAQMKGVEQYVERIIRCAEVSFPPEVRFIRSQRCTPQEEFAVVTAKRNNRQVYDFARTDVYLMKYVFEFMGEELKPHYVYLPYCSTEGLIYIRGSHFQITPVLADRAISVSSDSIFIPVNKDKLTFKRLIHTYYADGNREIGYVVWSPVYHVQKRKRGLAPKTVDMKTTIGHYLFAHAGVTRAFAEFANAEVYVGLDEIDEERFPPKEWIICTSQQIKPRGYKGKTYRGTMVRLAIRREQFNATTSALIAAFFYVADHFPERIVPNDIDDIALWRVTLGHAAFAKDDSEGNILNKIEDHMRSLDTYIDGMVREWLSDDGVYVENIYDLFMHVVETFTERVTHAGSSAASIYDKRLTVMRYILSDLISGTFNMSFALQRAAKKGLTKTDVINIIRNELRTEAIFNIRRQHGEVTSVTNPGDNPMHKITTSVVLQANSSGTHARAKAATIDASKLCHVSIAEVGSYTNLPKSEPSGRQRINPFVKIGKDGTIERDLGIAQWLDKIQESIDAR